MINIKQFTIVVPDTFPPKMRLDKAISQLLSSYSRTCLKEWILNFRVTVNGIILNRPNIRISCGDKIVINVVNYTDDFDSPQDIPLTVVYEDNDILVIDKQANLVVHPGAGNKNGTLLNALLYKNRNFAYIPRSGIVHRLDKDTTGLMIIAKNIISYNILIEFMKCKKIIRKYEAVVCGRVVSGGTIDKSIKRHSNRRTIMTTDVTGKKAITHYRIIKKFSYCTHLKIKLETGRTHQIRVHMLDINHPLIGDHVYNNKYKYLKGVPFKILKIVKEFPRQALHASQLCLKHPITGVWMTWNSCVPSDIKCLLNQLHQNDNG
ncbi:MAG: 23S rRNA pseudouridine(1911/1915/1917) synthase RluD [Buchnera aphidicola (Schlechtendalia peitan)]